jgi:hypothetical protein
MTAQSGEGLGVMSVTNRNLLSVNLLSCQLGDTATAQPALVCRASARELLPLLADRSPDGGAGFTDIAFEHPGHTAAHLLKVRVYSVGHNDCERGIREALDRAREAAAVRP